jgi:hypothetical protein
MKGIEYMTKDNSGIAAVQSMITNREDPSEIIELSDRLYILAASINDSCSCVTLLNDPLSTFIKLKDLLENQVEWTALRKNNCKSRQGTGNKKEVSITC